MLRTILHKQRFAKLLSLICIFDFSLRGIATTTCVLASESESSAYDLTDPKQMDLHKLYRRERVTPTKRGMDLLKDPNYNKVWHIIHLLIYF